MRYEHNQSLRDLLSRPTPYAIALILLVIFLDQVSKARVLDSDALRALDCLKGYALCGRIELSRFFDLTMVWNRGVSFGLLASDGMMRWGLFTMSLLIAGGFSVWLLRVTSWRTAIPLALIIGGAVGNMIDRFRFGAVVDFLDFSGLWFPFVFNVADACISVGAGLLFLDQVLAESRSD